MARVFIGVDPHKLSVTIEVVDARETVLATGRFATDKAGYAAMRRHVAAFPDRVWAVEGSNGAGRPLAQRLLADGESVVDVPAMLSARARLFDTGHNRKTDAHDAHAVAVVAVRTRGLRVLSYDGELEALRMLVGRRAELTRTRVQTVNRLQRLLSELTPGKAKKGITAPQAKTILAGVRPRDMAGRTRRRLAVEQLGELVALDKKITASTKELKAMVLARHSTLMDLAGVGPVVAARILADVGDVARFADRNRLASWTGTAPLDASSGEQIRHRLSRAGNRRANHMIHIAAVSQIRHDTPGRAYYRRKLAAGKTHTGTSDQPQPGPAKQTLPASTPARKTTPSRWTRICLLTSEGEPVCRALATPPAESGRGTSRAEDHGRMGSGWSLVNRRAASASTSPCSTSQSTARARALASRKDCQTEISSGWRSYSSFRKRRNAPLPSRARPRLPPAARSLMPSAKTTMSWYQT
jgi:transposase